MQEQTHRQALAHVEYFSLRPLITSYVAQTAARKRMACENQKPGWNDLQGGAHRLLGVIIIYYKD
jgi:hypothetical protein